jgi:hypothetical protein
VALDRVAVRPAVHVATLSRGCPNRASSCCASFGEPALAAPHVVVAVHGSPLVDATTLAVVGALLGCAWSVAFQEHG